MTSPSSHNNGISLATLLEWHKIRDTFFGHNDVSQNIPLALELASSCQHPDARWLTEVCTGKDVTTEEDAKRVFSVLGQNDARALCFTWMCHNFPDRMSSLESLLRRAADLGFAWAQALLARESGLEEKFVLAQQSAAQGERDAYAHLGCCARYGWGCEKNLDKAKENFLLASELGDVSGMAMLGEALKESDPQRWRWWGAAARLGLCDVFLARFPKQVEEPASAAVMFAIGQALQGHVNEEKRTIFNDKYDFGSRVGPAKQAIAFYEAQIKATKDAVHAWTLIGLHFGVVKDVRKLIAKLIWDWREEALL